MEITRHIEHLEYHLLAIHDLIDNEEDEELKELHIKDYWKTIGVIEYLESLYENYDIIPLEVQEPSEDELFEDEPSEDES